MKPSCHALFLVLLACAGLPAPALASDTYPSREFEQPRFEFPEQETPAMKLARELYALGQRIYGGKMQFKGGGEAAAQAPRLAIAQAQLPAREAKKKDLVALAGKLSPTEFVALVYYVNQRFPPPKKKP